MIECILWHVDLIYIPQETAGDELTNIHKVLILHKQALFKHLKVQINQIYLYTIIGTKLTLD
jgi:hypothetical protein